MPTPDDTDGETPDPGSAGAPGAPPEAACGGSSDAAPEAAFPSVAEALRVSRAAAVYLNVQQLLPEDRTAQTLSDLFGARLVCPASLTAWARKKAEDLESVYRAIGERVGRAKVRHLDDGFINHPVFARGPRPDWDWWNNQTGGMKPGFFTVPCVDAIPQIREKVLQALTETARKIAGG